MDLIMISEMPTTPCLSTSSATENALCRGVFSGMIWRSLWGQKRVKDAVTDSREEMRREEMRRGEKRREVI